MSLRVFAPGKMVLTGAYAVLRGAPAISVAVSRGAYAIAGSRGPASREVAAAIGEEPAPKVDTSALFDGDRKLGLGASAAGLVATLGLLAHDIGQDLSRPDVRASLFARARAAHGQAQQGGSGVDVATAVHGGTIAYRLSGTDAEITPCPLPQSIVVHAYASSTCARTTLLRAKVDALRTRDPVQDARVFDILSTASLEAHAACLANDAEGFLAASRAFGEALAALGRAAEAPLVSPAEVELARLAGSFGEAFFPSGAGGGDVAVRLLRRGSTSTDVFEAAARRAGWVPLDLGPDTRGVRLEHSAFSARPLEQVAPS